MLTISSIRNSQASHQLVVGNAQRKHACMWVGHSLSSPQPESSSTLHADQPPGVMDLSRALLSNSPQRHLLQALQPRLQQSCTGLGCIHHGSNGYGTRRHPNRVTVRNLSLFGSSCQLVAKMALCRYQCFAHWLMLVLCLHSFLINDALSPMPAKLEQCTHLCKQFIQSTAYLFFHRCQRFSLSATQSASNSFH